MTTVMQVRKIIQRRLRGRDGRVDLAPDLNAAIALFRSRDANTTGGTTPTSTSNTPTQPTPTVTDTTGTVTTPSPTTDTTGTTTAPTMTGP
jgi:hypothetical protein